MGFHMFQFLAISTRRYGTLGCRRTFPRHLLHRITTLVFAVSLMLFAQLIFTTPLNAESRDRPNIVLILADDNDLPLLQLTTMIERNIRQLSGQPEEDLPAPITPVDHLLT